LRDNPSRARRCEDQPDYKWRSLAAAAAWVLLSVYARRGDPAAALAMIDVTLANGACGDLRLMFEAGALLMIALGEWRDGWPLLASTAAWGVPEPNSPPIWHGQPPPATIDVYPPLQSSGFGDVLAYLRFLPLLRERGYDVHFRCAEPMVSLLARSLRGSGVTVGAVGQPSSAHYALPLFGLAPAFALEPHTIPAPLRLRPDSVRVAKYRSKIPGDTIGVCWASGPGGANLIKSIPLAALEPIWRAHPCVSLQIGPARAQLAGTPVMDLLPATPPTWEATAALAACCRAIVSVDTSVVHLAGGLGVPTHVPLHRGLANMFFLADVDGAPWQHVCPWYPATTRVYRPPADGDCRDVIARIAAALAA
jgi:hypothetical protein